MRLSSYTLTSDAGKDSGCSVPSNKGRKLRAAKSGGVLGLAELINNAPTRPRHITSKHDPTRPALTRAEPSPTQPANLFSCLHRQLSTHQYHTKQTTHPLSNILFSIPYNPTIHIQLFSCYKEKQYFRFKMPSKTTTTSTSRQQAAEKQKYYLTTSDSQNSSTTKTTDHAQELWKEPYTIDDSDLMFDGKPLNMLYEENRWQAEHPVVFYEQTPRGRSRQSRNNAVPPDTERRYIRFASLTFHESRIPRQQAKIQTRFFTRISPPRINFSDVNEKSSQQRSSMAKQQSHFPIYFVDVDRIGGFSRTVESRRHVMKIGRVEGFGREFAKAKTVDSEPFLIFPVFGGFTEGFLGAGDLGDQAWREMYDAI
ncbi:hypothetical protein VTL71DRAFT_14718 [Oculimacula yallundae]|uniref:Uncharacterized protein n=1 Tax=Oculimacula yallundae TaxID=86028 RepID=A0ABR4CJA5_9HELO